MEKKIYTDKLRVFSLIVVAVIVMAVSVTLLFVDNNASTFFVIVYYMIIVTAFYYCFIYAMDLFSRQPALMITAEGLYINYSYFKQMRLKWDTVTGLERERSVVMVMVRDVERHVASLPFITRLLIGSFVRRYGTVFMLKGYLLGTSAQELYEWLEAGVKTYAKEPRHE